ncbi:hypothetical protein [Celeribacter neptunius]|uniref:Beta-barrel porin 2 n=1 Tax=Celeribacter neptunius TaxID=588602 RepID=A0A1I3SEB8_9RHOB|nr:hypothetical protein [Celeribacter neptunius]SFJ55881.1 hypothetical protein SAMN04487991_2400 [Celeribacter neptunius]
MKKRSNSLRTSVSTAVICIAAISPALGQERGGLTQEFSLRQGFEATRNPTLTADDSDVRYLLKTDLSATLHSVSRQSTFSLTAAGRLNYPFGDVDSANKEFSLDRKNAVLRYAHIAPRAELSAYAQYLTDDISYLNAAELVADEDGVIVVPEDLASLQGTGTRENISYRLTAQFDQDQAFGWGVTLSGNELKYSNVSSSGLEDSSNWTSALNAHFDLTPTLRLDSQLSYAHRKSDSTAAAATTNFGLSLTAIQSDALSLRGSLAYADPENTSERYSLSAGLAISPTKTSQLSLDVGATFSDDFDTQLTGRLSYDARLTSTAQLGLSLNSSVTDTSDNDVVVTTAAVAGFDLALSPLSSLSLAGVYADENSLLTDDDTESFSASVQLNHQLDKNWQLSLGLSSTTRSETGSDRATSEAVYFNIGRSWQGRL